MFRTSARCGGNGKVWGWVTSTCVGDEDSKTFM